MNVIQNLLSAVSPQSDGDFVDRLNYCYSTIGLVVASAFISGWSFVGSPIQCWFPAYYKGWWMEYALDYCYVQNTYYVPIFEKDMPQTWDIGQHMKPLPVNDTVKEQSQIGYYQWVPFILAFQALAFYLPILFWRFLYESGGLKVNTILNTCTLSSNMDEESRKKNMHKAAGFLTQQHTAYDYDKPRFRRITTGRFVSFGYLFLKLLFALNAGMQFMMLRTILGVDSYNWGWDVATNLYNGADWEETGNFPRVTLCDFSVRELGNVHNHTVQCVLMINMFNEKIFLVLWFWLAIMFALTVISLVQWAIYLSMPSQGEGMVKRYIQRIDGDVNRSHRKGDTLRSFVNKHLRPDGVFLIKLIASNNGDMVTTSLLRSLWDEYTAIPNPPPYALEPLLMKNAKIDEAEL